MLEWILAEDFEEWESSGFQKRSDVDNVGDVQRLSQIGFLGKPSILKIYELLKRSFLAFLDFILLWEISNFMKVVLETRGPMRILFTLQIDILVYPGQSSKTI